MSVKANSNIITTPEQAEAWVRKNENRINLRGLCKDANISYSSLNAYLKGYKDGAGRPNGFYTPDTAAKLINIINEIIQP